MEKVITFVTLETQFHNIHVMRALVTKQTYCVEYVGDDASYLKSYDSPNNYFDGVEGQTDFWDCVNSFNESFRVLVRVIGREDKPLEERLTALVLKDVERRAGRSSTSSFKDDSDKPFSWFE